MTRIGKYCRRTTAGILSIWLSGIALLLFCQLPAKAAGEDFCPLAKASHGHCERSKDKNESELVSNPTPQSFDCCAFIPAVFDKTRKIDRKPQPAGIIQKTVPLRLKIRPVRRDWPKAMNAWARPAQGRMFIKHHALRI